VANERIIDTAQTAAESAAEAVGKLLGNETVNAAIDKAGDFYRKNPLLSKIGVAVAVAGAAALVTRNARR
jgi:3-deoxy-D-manno-octulosonate 8-phosphate phosphatase KdsC-like HAD superfamily phosphatase